MYLHSPQSATNSSFVPQSKVSANSGSAIKFNISSANNTELDATNNVNHTSNGQSSTDNSAQEAIEPQTTVGTTNSGSNNQSSEVNAPKDNVEVPEVHTGNTRDYRMNCVKLRNE